MTSGSTGAFGICRSTEAWVSSALASVVPKPNVTGVTVSSAVVELVDSLASD